MAEKRPGPRVFTVPTGVPFLDTLADALLSRKLVPFDADNPLALAGVTILLPTRRAVRAFREALVERLGGGAAILPAIRTIGDGDEEEHLLAPSAEPAADRLALPAAVTPLERRLTLTELTLAWGRAVRRETLRLAPDEPLLVPASAADAARLAGDLARLLDDMETAAIAWSDVGKLVPADHARYFQLTLDFLKIVAEQWPAHLKEIGRVDPAERRDALIRAYAGRVTGPIVAAGSTGSIPATAALLKAISRLPNGGVVLPGLDQELDDAAWSAIGEATQAKPTAYGHPQFGLKQLLGELQIARDAVVPLATPPDAITRRTRLIAEAMRPAETTDQWRGLDSAGGDALAGVDLLVARNEQEEATAIALAIREAVEAPDASVALVTPDRTIARRVAVELGRWGLAIDDSAGAPLVRTPDGVFARLTVEAALSGAEPVAMLALLKHPLAAFGMSRPACRRAARMLEVALFRGHRIVGGIAGLAEALDARRREIADGAGRVPMARRRMSEDDWRTAETLVTRIAETLQPLEQAFGENHDVSAGTASGLLAEAIAAAATDDEGENGLDGVGAAGEALAGLLAGLAEGESEARHLTLPAGDFPFFLATLMGEVAVSGRPGADPRIHIWGTLEARLQSVDLLILAGLDEGVWPAETRTDPFLSRAMRAELGLPPPERRIGLAAHDFTQGMAMRRVIVTRAEKRGGTPTVESRWLQRLRALIGETEANALAGRGQRFVSCARALDYDRRAPPVPIERPKPKPPLAARPRHLSITEIETLIRDPYAIYARRVLRLEPLDDLGKAPDRAMRGTLMHDALGRFIGEWTGPFDAEAETRLAALGGQMLAAIEDFPDIHAVWSIRFRAIARWFVAWEAARARRVATRHAEIDGKLEIPSPGGVFTLRGRADRIDEMADGRVAIYDFKTGTPQTERTVFAGLTPQMTLEAAMARAGAFPGIPAGRSVSDLAWLALGKVGRGDPYMSAVRRGESADGLADSAQAMFAALVHAFDREETPYLSRARPMMERARYLGDYDHLARVREWALVESATDVVMMGGGTP